MFRWFLASFPNKGRINFFPAKLNHNPLPALNILIQFVGNPVGKIPRNR